jgi:hypothetical protein
MQEHARVRPFFQPVLLEPVMAEIQQDFPQSTLARREWERCSENEQRLWMDNTRFRACLGFQHGAGNEWSIISSAGILDATLCPPKSRRPLSLPADNVLYPGFHFSGAFQLYQLSPTWNCHPSAICFQEWQQYKTRLGHCVNLNLKQGFTTSATPLPCDSMFP